MVGREHYTDLEFLTLNARRSAEAVRKMLDTAEEGLREVASEGGTALVQPDEPPPRRSAELGGMP